MKNIFHTLFYFYCGKLLIPRSVFYHVYYNTLLSALLNSNWALYPVKPIFLFLFNYYDIRVSESDLGITIHQNTLLPAYHCFIQQTLYPNYFFFFVGGGASDFFISSNFCNSASRLMPPSTSSMIV